MSATSEARQVNEISNQVCDVIHSRMDQMPDGQTLYVILGENHGACAHILCQTKVVDRLTRSGLSVSFAEEMPHQFLYQIAKSYYDLRHYDLVGKEERIYQNLDEENKRSGYQLSETALQGGKDRGYAPTTRTFFSLCCAQNGVPIHHVDAEFIKNQYGEASLDLSDKITANCAALSPLSKLDLNKRNHVPNTITPYGCHVRNMVMKENTLRKTQGADIVVMGVGAAHVAGDYSPKGPLDEQVLAYEHSLHALFEESDLPVLGFVFNEDYSDTLKKLPEVKEKYDGGDLHWFPMSARSFGRFKLPLPALSYVFGGLAGERVHLSRLLPLVDSPLSLYDIEEYRVHSLEATVAAFDRAYEMA